jgi:hypothetical protein
MPRRIVQADRAAAAANSPTYVQEGRRWGTFSPFFHEAAVTLAGMPTSEREPRVVVAYGSGVIASAVERRVRAYASVELVPVGQAPQRLRRRSGCDAVLLDPVLTELERRRVRDAAASVPRPPVLVQIRNASGHVAADIEGDAPLGDALGPVVAALTR